MRDIWKCVETYYYFRLPSRMCSVQWWQHVCGDCVCLRLQASCGWRQPHHHLLHLHTYVCQPPLAYLTMNISFLLQSPHNCIHSTNFKFIHLDECNKWYPCMQSPKLINVGLFLQICCTPFLLFRELKFYNAYKFVEFTDKDKRTLQASNIELLDLTLNQCHFNIACPLSSHRTFVSHTTWLNIRWYRFIKNTIFMAVVSGKGHSHQKVGYFGFHHYINFFPI